MTATVCRDPRWRGLPDGDGPDWTPLADAERVVLPLLSEYVGVCTKLYRQMHDVDDIAAFAVGVRACESRHVLGENCAQVSGGGSLDERAATVAAVAETVERYSASYRRRDVIVEASWAALAAQGREAVRPAAVQLFTEQQLADPRFPYERFTDDTRISWTHGLDLASGRPVLLPAGLVDMAGPTQERASTIAYSTSNGLAAGCTWDEAVASGLLELVERDGFCTVWHNTLSMPLIDPDSDPAVRDFFDRWVRPTGLDVALVDLSCFSGVPAVLAVVRNRSTGVGPLALGSAAAGTAARAIMKAIVEAFQTRVWMMAERRDGNQLGPDADFAAEVRSFDDHVRLYAGPELIFATEFLDAGRDRVAVADLPTLPDHRPRALVRAVLDRLGEQDVDVYVADVTSPDVAEAGMVVARVFAPALVPLDAAFLTRFIGPPRLRQRPVDLGLLAQPRSDDELNPFPHPFP